MANVDDLGVINFLDDDDDEYEASGKDQKSSRANQQGSPEVQTEPAKVSVESSRVSYPKQNGLINFLDDEDEDYEGVGGYIPPVKHDFEKQVVVDSSASESSSVDYDLELGFDDVLNEEIDVLNTQDILESNAEKNIEEASLAAPKEQALYNKSSATSSLLEGYLDDEDYDEDEEVFTGFEDSIVEHAIDAAADDSVEEVEPVILQPPALDARGKPVGNADLLNDSFVDGNASDVGFDFVDKPAFDENAVASFEKSQEINEAKNSSRIAQREAMTGLHKVGKLEKKKKKGKNDQRNNFPAPTVSIRQVDGEGRPANLIGKDGQVIDLSSGNFDQGDSVEFYDETGRAIRTNHSLNSVEAEAGRSIASESHLDTHKPKREVGNGRLSKKELEFYNNLALAKTRDSLSNGFSTFVNAPVNLLETPTEKREREARINLALFGEKGVAKKGGTRFTEGDKRVLEFLALLKYATSKHIAILFGVKIPAAEKRLRKLREAGLVKIKSVYGIGSLYYLSHSGMMLSGYDLPRVTEQNITLSMVSHQSVVNHVAANLLSAGLNILNESNYPVENRVDKFGRPQYGDNITSELEIQSSLGKMKSFDKSSAYKPLILSTIRNQFSEWAKNGRQGLSPEFAHGNEFMWALYPPASANLVYHVPDLVVKRPRSADGRPNSIAVEIELLKKSPEAYMKTLEAYRTDKIMYKKVVWVCKSVGSAKILEKIAKENKMWENGKLRIVPIYTQDGVFRGKNVWDL